MRNMGVVDILKCDDYDFKGTITPTEAKNVIYKETLNLNRLNLHGIKVEYKGNPVISFYAKGEDQHQYNVPISRLLLRKRYGKQQIQSEE